jgi:hypothetical protein
MTRLSLSILATCCVLSACAFHRSVRVVEKEPKDCEFLGGVSVWQFCAGGAGSEAIESMKKDAYKMGGDTLHCCEEGTEELVLSRTGRGPAHCFGAFEYSGRAYSCSVGHNKPLQPIAPKDFASVER